MVGFKQILTVSVCFFMVSYLNILNATSNDTLPSKFANSIWSKILKKEVTVEVQKELTKGYLEEVSVDNLNEIEALALAELYFLSLDPEKAKLHFTPLQNSDEELIAKHALARLIRINFAAYNDFELALNQIKIYKSLYTPSLEDYFYTYRGLSDQCRYLISKDRFQESYEVVMSGLIDDGIEYTALPRLLDDCQAAFKSKEQKKVLDRLVSEYLTLLNAMKPLEDLMIKESDNDCCNSMSWAWYYKAQGVRKNESLVVARLRNIQKTIDKLNKVKLK